MATLPADSPIFKDTEYVFHFGGLGDIVPSIERPLDYTHSNITGTLAVLEAARQRVHGIPLSPLRGRKSGAWSPYPDGTSVDTDTEDSHTESTESAEFFSVDSVDSVDSV